MFRPRAPQQKPQSTAPRRASERIQNQQNIVNYKEEEDFSTLYHKAEQVYSKMSLPSSNSKSAKTPRAIKACEPDIDTLEELLTSVPAGSLIPEQVLQLIIAELNSLVR